jgi:phage tail sheath protein FI
MSSDAAWRFVNVRRTVSAISAAIERGMQWVVFEPNKPSLWKRIVANISIFLSDLWRLGLLTGASPEQAFFVQCDDETNPQAEVNKGRITTKIGVAVARPVEFIIFRVSQRLEDQGQTSEE